MPLDKWFQMFCQILKNYKNRQKILISRREDAVSNILSNFQKLEKLIKTSYFKLHPLFQRKCLSNHGYLMQIPHLSLSKRISALHPLYQCKCLSNCGNYRAYGFCVLLHPLFQRKCLSNGHDVDEIISPTLLHPLIRRS